MQIEDDHNCKIQYFTVFKHKTKNFSNKQQQCRCVMSKTESLPVNWEQFHMHVEKIANGYTKCLYHTSLQITVYGNIDDNDYLV